MNKNLLIIIFLFMLPVRGQDTVVADPPRIEEFIPAATDTVTFRDRTFEPGFQERYKSEEFIYERKSKGKSQFERFREWLAGIIDDLFSFGDNANSATSIILKVLAGLILLSVVYLIVRKILDKDSIWIFGRSRKNIIAEDVMPEDIHETDFASLIDKTKETHNYRLAVRYYYLWLLKKMSLREIIKWNYEKTNSDYVYEIKDSALRKEFEYLSYLYDYSWYGEFPLDGPAFDKAEKAFLTTLKTL